MVIVSLTVAVSATILVSVTVVVTVDVSLREIALLDADVTNRRSTSGGSRIIGYI